MKSCNHEWRLVGEVGEAGEMKLNGRTFALSRLKCLRCGACVNCELRREEVEEALADRIETLKLESDFHADAPR